MGPSPSGLWYTFVHAKQLQKKSNVYVSGKNNKILPIPETMQGISTSAESKEERNKNNNNNNNNQRLHIIILALVQIIKAK